MQNNRNFTAEYKFHKYPMHVTLADGSYVVVHNEEEEAAARGDAEEEGADERAALFEKAKSLGLNPHHKVGVAKLREMIAEAGE